MKKCILLLLLLIVPALSWADSAVPDLTALAAPSDDDVLYIVDDPGGSPLDRKVTIAVLKTTMGAGDISSVYDCTTAACTDMVMSGTMSLDASDAQFLYLPGEATTCAETVEGSVCWDEDSDILYVGNNGGQTAVGALGSSITAAEMADADFGDWTCATGSCTMDADTIAAAEMANADHGDVEWAAGVATVEGFVVDEASTVANDITIRFGSAATDWFVEFDDSGDDQLLWHSTAAGAAATTDPMFEILGDFGTATGSSMTANQQIFGVAKGTQASNVALFTVDEDGDAAVTGILTVGTINLPSSDASPATTAGQVRHDSTVTGIATGALAWWDGDEIRYLVDLETLPSDDDYVVTYDAAADGFYMNAAGTGDITDIWDCATGNCDTEVALSDGDFLDMSAVSVTAASEGIYLPQHATDCSAATAEGQVCWEVDADKLWVGDGAAPVDITAAAGSTTWDNIGNAAADGNVSLIGYEQIITTTLDEAAHVALKIDHTDADVAAATTIFQIDAVDDGQALLTFIKVVDDSGVGANTVFSVGADGAIVTDGTITAGSGPKVITTATGELDGDVIDDDSVDDDALDFGDITCADITMTDCGAMTSTGAVDFSGGTTVKSAVGEATSCAAHTAEGATCWEQDANKLWIGDGAAAKAVGGSVGPGFGVGDSFDDGVESTGGTALIWEGTVDNTDEFRWNLPEDPNYDITFTIPNFAAAQTITMSATNADAASYIPLHDAEIVDLAGTGLTVVAESLTTTLGTAIVTGEITDGTILEVDLDLTTPAGAGQDNYYLTYDHATNGFTWASGTGGVSFDAIAPAVGSGDIVFADTYTQTFSTAQDTAGTFLTIDDTDTAVSGNVYLLELQHSDDGEANADFFKCVDANTTVKFSIQEEGNTTIVGTLSAGDAAFTVDADGDVVAKSYTSSKVSGEAGKSLLYEATTTETNGMGWMGPAGVTDDLYYQFSSTQPVAAAPDYNIMAFVAESADTDLSVQSWLILDDGATNGATTSLWSADKIYDTIAASGSGLVGDCTVATCLDGTSDGGTYIRLYDNGFYGSLDPTSLSAHRTYTLPDFTGTVAMQGGALTTGQAGTDGSLTIYSEQGATDYSVVLTPDAAMTATTTYTLPPNDGTADYVLATDGSGGLDWVSPGTGTAWDAISIPGGDKTLAFGNTEQVISSTLDESGGVVLELYQSDATLTNETVILQLSGDSADDAEMIYFRVLEDRDGTPATLVTIDADGDIATTGTVTATGIITGAGFTAGSAVLAESELEALDGITAGTAAASKALILDASSDIATINSITATTFVGELTGNASTASSVDWDDLDDPDAGTPATFTFNADNEETTFDYTAAFTTASSPDLFTIIQQTGNAQAVDLLNVSAADSDVFPIRITHAGEDLFLQYSAANKMKMGTGTSVDTLEFISIGLDITGAAELTLQNDETITNAVNGTVATSGDFSIVGGDLVFGNITARIGGGTEDSITFNTDGTGDGEIVLENDSIGDAEIDWEGLTASHIFASPGITLTADSTLTSATPEFIFNDSDAGADGTANVAFQSAGAYDITTTFQTDVGGTLTTMLTLDGVNNKITLTPNVELTADITPDASSGSSLGTDALDFSDIFLADAAVINLDSGDVTITHASDTLAFAGATSSYTFDDAVDISGADGLILSNDETITNAVDGTIAFSGNLTLPNDGVISFTDGTNTTLTHADDVGLTLNRTFQASRLTDGTVEIYGGDITDVEIITMSYAAPVFTMEDTSAATGGANINFASSGAYDVQGIFSVDEGGTAVQYLSLDGANDRILIGQPAPNDNNVKIVMRLDADSDAADTTEDLTIELTPNADPTLATWAIKDKQTASLNITSTAGDVILNAQATDQDIVLNVDDGGVNKTVTIDGSESEIVTTLQIATTGDIMGGKNVSSQSGAYTVGTDDAHEAYGTLFTNSNVADLTLPATEVVGMNGCLMQEAGVTGIMKLQPAGGAHLVYLGVEMADGTDLASGGAATDKICWVCVSSDHYIITDSVGTWGE